MQPPQTPQPTATHLTYTIEQVGEIYNRVGEIPSRYREIVDGLLALLAQGTPTPARTLLASQPDPTPETPSA